MNGPYDFTVVIPIYIRNDPLLFKNCIKSVLANTLLPNKIIIIVDGPISDKLNQEVNYCKNISNVLVLRFKKHKGLTFALNYSIKKVETTWVARMDGDDFCMPNRFYNQISHLKKNNHLMLLGSNIIEYDPILKKKILKKVPISYSEILNFYKIRNPFNHMTVIFNTKFFKNIGGYPDLFLKEDYGLWIKFIASGAKVENLDTSYVKVDAGDNLYKRRSGYKLVLSEYKLQKFFYQKGLKSLIRMHLDFIIRGSIFMLPNFIRKFIYIKFLRT